MYIPTDRKNHHTATLIHQHAGNNMHTQWCMHHTHAPTRTHQHRITISMHQQSLTKNNATTLFNMHAPTGTNHMNQRNCSHQHACIHQHVLTQQHAGTYTHSQTMNAPTHMLQHVRINKHTLTCTQLHERKHKKQHAPKHIPICMHQHACTNMHTPISWICGKFSTCNWQPLQNQNNFG